jgi:hypothetical protein
MLDLSLAETYVPGCVCAAKAGVLCATLTVLRAAGVPAFQRHVLGATLLFLDRQRARERVLDTNAVACLVLFAAAYHDGRAAESADFRKVRAPCPRAPPGAH